MVSKTAGRNGGPAGEILSWGVGTTRVAVRDGISFFSQPSVGRGRNSLKKLTASGTLEWDLVTVGLQLQLVCCAIVSSLDVPHLCGHSEPIKGE